MSRKTRRDLKRLRKDATKLWSEQQAVNERAAELFGRAKHQAVRYGQNELLPSAKSVYDQNFRPGLERGLAVARDAADDARLRFNGGVLPGIATVLGSIAGGLAQASKSDALPQQLRQLDLKGTAKSARRARKDLEKRARKAVREYDRKHGKSGLGAGGWILVGTGAAVVAALGYALWQTFRADDDLWIADDELDAPITTVKPRHVSETSGTGTTTASTAPGAPAGEKPSTLERAAEQGINTSDVATQHLATDDKDSAPGVGRPKA